MIRFPHCERCSKKGLNCSYDLEPLSQYTTLAFQKGQGSLEKHPDGAIHCLLNKDSQHRHHGSCPMPTAALNVREGIEYVLAVLAQVPHQVTGQRPSIFIHPGRRHSANHHWLSQAMDDVRACLDIRPSHKNFQALLRTDSIYRTLGEILIEVQAMMLYLLVFMFQGNSETQTEARLYFPYLTQRVKQLEDHVPEFDGLGLTPWQAWLFGESTRRTILSSHVLTCVFFQGRYEAPDAKLHMESLPFDDRGGLWLAETAQAWLAAAGERRGTDVRTNLVSWHEFGCKSPSICMAEDGDVFLSMMLVCHNGKSSLGL